MTREQYFAIDAVSITRLKEIDRSPLHYRHLLANPKESDALTLGTAAHSAILEPETFADDYAIWTRRTEANASAPRRGQHWDAFKAEHPGQRILTVEENAYAQAIARAVRFDEVANKYLVTGDAEVVMQWEIVGRRAKSRADWVTEIDGKPVLVGLKSTRDCRHTLFAKQAVNLGYDLQWSWYADGFQTIHGMQPRMVEIAVESEPPHAVATYLIDDEILELGRSKYEALLLKLARCEESNEWPGPQTKEELLSFPSWAYPSESDLSDVGLSGLEYLNV